MENRLIKDMVIRQMNLLKTIKLATLPELQQAQPMWWRSQTLMLWIWKPCRLNLNREEETMWKNLSATCRRCLTSRLWDPQWSMKRKKSYPEKQLMYRRLRYTLSIISLLSRMLQTNSSRKPSKLKTKDLTLRCPVKKTWSRDNKK